MVNYWLMKAECDTRLVNGHDVRFSVDDFEKCPDGITAWEGVRNHQAKNNMKAMKLGDGVLFYHSNCKDPGIAAFAEVCKEAYPDHSAWDTKHPYYDPKTDPENPRWYMVSLLFKRRLPHFISLALLKSISSDTTKLDYLTEEMLGHIKSMQLLNRGRLSVQSVSEGAWGAVGVMSEKGGWGEKIPKPKSPKKEKTVVEENGDDTGTPKRKTNRKRKASKEEDTESDLTELEEDEEETEKEKVESQDDRTLKRKKTAS